jgi:hypothetical protein
VYKYLHPDEEACLQRKHQHGNSSANINTAIAAAAASQNGFLWVHSMLGASGRHAELNFSGGLATSAQSSMHEHRLGALRLQPGRLKSPQPCEVTVLLTSAAAAHSTA